MKDFRIRYRFASSRFSFQALLYWERLARSWRKNCIFSMMSCQYGKSFTSGWEEAISCRKLLMRVTGCGLHGKPWKAAADFPFAAFFESLPPAEIPDTIYVFFRILLWITYFFTSVGSVSLEFLNGKQYYVAKSAKIRQNRIK